MFGSSSDSSSEELGSEKGKRKSDNMDLEERDQKYRKVKEKEEGKDFRVRAVSLVQEKGGFVRAVKEKEFSKGFRVRAVALVKGKGFCVRAVSMVDEKGEDDGGDGEDWDGWEEIEPEWEVQEVGAPDAGVPEVIDLTL